MRNHTLCAAYAMALTACSASSATPPGSTQDPTSVVAVQMSAEDQTVLAQQRAALASNSSLTTETLFAKHPVAYASALPFDTAHADRLNVIQASPMALSEAELAKFKDRGLVVSDRNEYPTFSYGYSAIYFSHLPLFISADSMLDAVHRSFDNILETVEQSSVVPTLQSFLEATRSKLASATLDSRVRADLDVYLTVADSLLQGKALVPTAGGNASTVADLYTKADAGIGTAEVTLFGTKRQEDFSQFTPRGHYTKTPKMRSYFRAMMWLGRVDFRLLETQADGSQLFHRAQFDAMIALNSLVDDEARAKWQRIDRVVSNFMGEHDSMILPQVSALLADLGVAASSDLTQKTDQELATALVAKGYGQQRIASRIIIKGPTKVDTLPLDSSFALFGQRYTVDSHVLSNVVHDRVAARRMMPNPLDVAYAAFGNDHALPLLTEDLTKYQYAGALENVRTLVDAHPATYWSESLYGSWTDMLRSLSPKAAEVQAPASAGLPAIVGTEGWGRRILNTQLSSWAQLRRDTILYAKQSYTTGVSCEFPDAYVEPNVAFWTSLLKYADNGAALANLMPEVVGMSEHFQQLHDAVTVLRQIAIQQTKAQPLSAEQLAFVNQTVKIQTMCGGASAEGWYPRLVFGSPTEDDPTIADVHTQPTDEAGAPVGRVLHVGTGHVRPMVVAIDSCTGAPRAFVGLISTYYEKTTENFQRLNDSDWSKLLPNEKTVSWMAPLYAP